MNDTTIEQLQARIAELELQIAALVAKINELVPYVDYGRMQRQQPLQSLSMTGFTTGYMSPESWRGWEEVERQRKELVARYLREHKAEGGAE